MYDTYRLWALSTDLIQDIGELDLDCVLGSRRNADELRRLVEVIETMDFTILN